MTIIAATSADAAIIPGTSQYWAARREGFRLIGTLEKSIERCRQAARYTGSGGENIGPFDANCRAEDAVKANPVAVSILAAQGRLFLLSMNGWYRHRGPIAWR